MESYLLQLPELTAYASIWPLAKVHIFPKEGLTGSRQIAIRHIKGSVHMHSKSTDLYER